MSTQTTSPTGDTPQAAARSAITREILEDRWEGLFGTDDGTASGEYVGEAEQRYIDLAETIGGIIARVSRNQSVDEDISQGGLTDEVYDLVRETILSRALEIGWAR